MTRKDHGAAAGWMVIIVVAVVAFVVAPCIIYGLYWLDQTFKPTTGQLRHADVAVAGALMGGGLLLHNPTPLHVQQRRHQRREARAWKRFRRQRFK